jgi:hypothetical protein
MIADPRSVLFSALAHFSAPADALYVWVGFLAWFSTTACPFLVVFCCQMAIQSVGIFTYIVTSSYALTYLS